MRLAGLGSAQMHLGRPGRLGLVGFALALAAIGACGGGDPGADPVASTPGPSPATEPSVPPGLDDGAPTVPTTSSTPAPTSAGEPTPTSVPAAVSTSGAVEGWEAFWSAVSVPDGDDEGLAAAAAWGTDDAIAGVRSFPWGDVDRQVANHPVATAVDEATVTIDDCIVHEPGFPGALWWAGEVELREGRWVVTRAEMVERLAPCIPAEINDAVLAAYEQHWDARDVFWASGDGHDPALTDTTTEPQLQHFRALLERGEAEGFVVRGRPETHPEVIEFIGFGRVVVLDCQGADPTHGAYDRATGERRIDLIPLAREGQTDLRSTVLTFVDGRWKVADVQGQIDFECVFAPTDNGIPVI